MRIHGVVQHYAWGTRDVLPALLGRPADGRPWAEYWLGTHHGGPATLDDGRRLQDETGELPYLVKLLSAAEPLSLQTHPSADQAAAGFARENAAGVALDDPARTFGDPYAKPELLVALSQFDALCGFRPVDATADLLVELGLDDLAEHLADHGLERTVGEFYHAPDWQRIVASCNGHSGREARLVTSLAARYPGDPSVVVTLLLNRVTLEAGEAVYLTPGNLHAYLGGTGVEVMGASDNVVRGGMTTKHVDTDLLLDTLNYEELAEPCITAQVRAMTSGVTVMYPVPGAPFEVTRVLGTIMSELDDRPGIWVCTAGPRTGQAAYGHPTPRPAADETWFRVATEGTTR